jgi:hypothetical protein
VRALEVEHEAAEDVDCVVVLEAAVARVSLVAVSFVAWVYAGVGLLQRSRKSIHLRRGAPIAGIA